MSSGSRWVKTAIRGSSRAAAITRTSTSRRGMVGESAGAHSYRQNSGRATFMMSATGRANTETCYKRLSFHVRIIAERTANGKFLLDVFLTDEDRFVHGLLNLPAAGTIRRCPRPLKPST